ncbi:MAG: T9SS type A sorting domain-containing protein [Flavobacteriales bacterium]|nr:T9SS type A sorting domain-containing protein [Flavobacteriales bacterium]
MKKNLLAAIVLMSAFNLQSQIQYLRLDTLCSGDCPGIAAEYTTVQLVAHCTNATDVVSTIYGLIGTPLHITTDCCFYHSPVGANTGSEINCALCTFFPDLCYDSWVTVGCECSTDCSQVFTLQNANQQWLNAFNTPGCGGSIFIDDAIGGAWFTTPNQPQAMAGDDLDVLLGQFTTCGCIDILINCQVFPNYNGPGSPDIQQTGLAISTCAACADPGCMDSEAANYDADAICENPGMCVYCNLAVDSVAVNNPTCGNDMDGSVSIDGSGAEGFLEFHLGDDDNLSGIFNGLGNGTYTITLVDQYFEPGQPGNEFLPDGCLLDVEVVLNTPAVNYGSFTSSNVTCFGLSDGCATHSFSGGLDPIEFMIQHCSDNSFLENEEGNTLVLSTPVYCSIPAGTWRWVATDASGCEYLSSCFGINQPADIVLTYNAVTNATCAESSDGGLCIGWFGGTGDVDFTFEPGGTLEEGNCWFNTFAPGTYDIYAVDANGCDGSGEFTISSPDSVQIQTSVLPALCSYSIDGCISATATGGSGDSYIFYLEDGIPFADGNNNCGLGAGDYTVQAIDDLGCEGTVVVTVTAAEELESNILTNSVSCNGDVDGSITASASGGTGPYTYDIGDGPVTEGIFNDLEPATYSLIITDANLCTGTFNFTISEPNVLTATTEVTDPLCDTAFGSLAVMTTGGTSPFSYSIDGMDPQTDNLFESLNPGTYDLVVVDANGCTFSLQGIVGDTPDPITFGAPDVECAAFDGTCDGSIAVSVSGGTAGYDFEWMDDNGNVVSTDAVPADLCEGDYTLLVTDANGCEQEYASAIEVCVGIGELSSIAQIELSPNPTSGKFAVHITGMPRGAWSYSILDAAGNLVMKNNGQLESTWQTVDEEIDLTGYASGTYFLSMMQGNYSSTFKVVKE